MKSQAFRKTRPAPHRLSPPKSPALEAELLTVRPMERERKFLITQAPPGLNNYPHKPIRQGCFVIPDSRDKASIEIRVRDEAGNYQLTVKAGPGASRSEIEVPLAAGGSFARSGGSPTGNASRKCGIASHWGTSRWNWTFIAASSAD